MNALGISYDKGNSGSDESSGFSYMIAAGIMIGALVLFAACHLNILKIAVSKRIKEYGTLRAIGGQQGQLYRLVAEQLILLCFVGISLGAVLGVLKIQHL